MRFQLEVKCGGTASCAYDDATLDAELAKLDALPADMQAGTQEKRDFIAKCRAKLLAKKKTG